MKIGIVGGGTAGLTAALILKTRFPKFQIDIIRSKKIGIVGVGEGSTEHWLDFSKFVGIDTGEMIAKCDATFKIGIMFKGWGVPDYMHSIQDGFNLVVNRHYPYIYSRLISQGASSAQTSGEQYWNNKIPEWFIENNQVPVAQYHFNTFKLNDFLTTVSIERGITFFDDEINDITLNNLGEIESISSLTDTYTYDFFLDCTGMKKLLISKLGGVWKSHSKYLKTNTAMLFQTDDTDEYNMWSLSQAMKYGWMFHTPTYGRWGNGYVYDCEFLTPEQAQQEVEEFLGKPIHVEKIISFDPGAIDRPWIKNCCAIGLSSGFVEPLEASSIGASIQQTFILADYLVNYNSTVINRYNSEFKSMILNIRDFIVLHFICPRRDTAFWKKVANTEIPDSLKENLNIWKYKLPIDIDFNNTSKYALFKSLHFLMILHGLQLFDLDSIKKEFDALPTDTQQDADRVIDELFTNNSVNLPNLLGHKEMITYIRGHANGI